MGWAIYPRDDKSRLPGLCVQGMGWGYGPTADLGFGRIHFNIAAPTAREPPLTPSTDGDGYPWRSSAKLKRSSREPPIAVSLGRMPVRSFVPKNCCKSTTIIHSERIETTSGKISARRVPVILVNPKTGRLFGGISDPNWSPRIVDGPRFWRPADRVLTCTDVEIYPLCREMAQSLTQWRAAPQRYEKYALRAERQCQVARKFRSTRAYARARV